MYMHIYLYINVYIYIYIYILYGSWSYNDLQYQVFQKDL